MEDEETNPLSLARPLKRPLDLPKIDRDECERELKLARDEPTESSSLDRLKQVFARFAPRPDMLSAEKAEEQVDALAMVAQDGLSGVAHSGLFTKSIQKMAHGDKTIVAKSQVGFESNAAKCITWKSLIVFIGALVFSGPGMILRTFAKFVSEKRSTKQVFELLVDDTGVCNTHLTRFCLSYVMLEKSKEKPKNLVKTSLDSAFAKKKGVDLVAFQIYVTINPGKGYTGIPAQRLLLLSQGNMNCHVFYGFVPRDLSPTEYKECIEAYLDSIDVEAIVKQSFPFTRTDATTVSTDQLSVFNYFIMVGKGKLAEEKYEIKNGIFSKEKWPQICVVTRITKVGDVENLGLTKNFDPNGLHNLLGNLENQHLIKISNLCGGFDKKMPTEVYMGLSNLTDSNFFTNASMKKALLNSGYISKTSIVEGKSTNEYMRVSSLNTRGGLNFDVKMSDNDLTWAVHSRLDQCCIGDTLPDNVYLSLGTSFKDQEDIVMNTVGSMPGIMTGLYLALNESIKRVTEMQVPAVRIPPYHPGMCEPLSRSLAAHFISFSDDITKRAEEDSDYEFDIDKIDSIPPYSSTEMENIEYITCLAPFKIRCCEPDSGAVFDTNPSQSVFQLVIYLLFCMVVCKDSVTVYNVMNILEFSNCVNYDVFFDNPRQHFTKELASKHFFVMLLSSLFWVVDVVYGRAKKMPKSWLSMQFEGYDRSQSFADFVALAVSSCEDKMYTQCKLPAYASINPKKMLKILAIVREWQLRGDTKSWEDVVADVSTWDCEKAKDHLINLMDDFVQMKAKYFPTYDGDDTIQLPAAFDEAVDSFTVSDADVGLSGSLPGDLDLHGCSVLTPPIADGAAGSAD